MTHLHIHHHCDKVIMVAKNCFRYTVCHRRLKITMLNKMSAQELGVLNNESPHGPLWALAFKVDILNYELCQTEKMCIFAFSVT